MGYNEKIMDVRNDINNRNYEIAISKLENMLKESNVKEVEDEKNTYYTFGNYAEEAIFNYIYKSKKQNIYPEQNISEIYYYLGFINIDLKNYDLAVEYLDKALKWNPINISAMFEKATVFRMKGNLDRNRAEIEKTFIFIYNSSYLAKFYRELGWYYVERKIYDLGNALYTYSNYFYKTNNAENELKYIAQQENREIRYTPIAEINQYLKDYNIPINFNRSIVNCIFDELQKVKNNNEKRSSARYYSNLMYDMTLRKEFIWYEPLKNEEYAVQIDKPDHWTLIAKDSYERYGLDNNTVFAFFEPQIQMFTVTFVGECTNNQFEDKFNKIIEDLKNSGEKVISQFIEPTQKRFGNVYTEKQIGGNVIRYNQEFMVLNDKLFKISWESNNIKPPLLNDEVALNVSKTLQPISGNEMEQEQNSIDFKVEQESLLRLINDEYAKNGINLTLYNLLNKFSKNNLKDDSLDPFWKENARLLLNAIIILILTGEKEATIEDIKEKSKNIETLKKYCEDNLFKLDIASIQQFPDLMDGITYIRKSEANKTINSTLEIINESI